MYRIEKKWKESENTYYRLKQSVTNMKHIKGGKYVLCLVKNANKEFPYFFLEQCFNDKLNFEVKDICDFEILRNASEFFMNSPILMCDNRTKSMVKHRLNQIIAHIANAEAMDCETELYDLYQEKQQLITYLAEVLGANNKIKYFHESLLKPKKAVLINIKRFFNELSIIDKDLSKYTENGLKISKFTLSYQDKIATG